MESLLTLSALKIIAAVFSTVAGILALFFEPAFPKSAKPRQTSKWNPLFWKGSPLLERTTTPYGWLLLFVIVTAPAMGYIADTKKDEIQSADLRNATEKVVSNVETQTAKSRNEISASLQAATREEEADLNKEVSLSTNLMTGAVRSATGDAKQDLESKIGSSTTDMTQTVTAQTHQARHDIRQVIKEASRTQEEQGKQIYERELDVTDQQMLSEWLMQRDKFPLETVELDYTSEIPMSLPVLSEYLKRLKKGLSTKAPGIYNSESPQLFDTLNDEVIDETLLPDFNNTMADEEGAAKLLLVDDASFKISDDNAHTTVNYVEYSGAGQFVSLSRLVPKSGIELPSDSPLLRDPFSRNYLGLNKLFRAIEVSSNGFFEYRLIADFHSRKFVKEVRRIDARDSGKNGQIFSLLDLIGSFLSWTSSCPNEVVDTVYLGLLSHQSIYEPGLLGVYPEIYFKAGEKSVCFTPKEIGLSGRIHPKLIAWYERVHKKGLDRQGIREPLRASNGEGK